MSRKSRWTQERRARRFLIMDVCGGNRNGLVRAGKLRCMCVCTERLFSTVTF